VTAADRVRQQEEGQLSEPNRAGETRIAASRTRRPADFTADGRMIVLAGLALVVGSLGTLAAWCLVNLIALVTNATWFGRISGTLPSMAGAHRSWWMVAAPALGGLVIGLMARYGSKAIRGHGIPEAIEVILNGNSRIAPKVALLKPLSAAVSIGTGGPFGAEGPIIMTGGAIGSLFAQFFHLSSAERKTLLVAGAAAGMTAIFGTPVAAVLLAVEVLLFEWKPRSFIPVCAAVLVATGWRPLAFGAAPLFPLPHIPALPPWIDISAAALGVLIGLQSAVLTTALYGIEDLFERLPIHWMWWPALGGVVVGLGGLIEPRALGVGYDIIGDLLHDRMVMHAIVAILLVKAAIWLVALASGTSGGVLAPLLILGGALGALFGLALPGHDPGVWALIGMAAILGGSLRAPLTGAVFAAEITGTMQGLPALVAATVAAYAVTVLLLPRSILTEKIARRGRHITQEYSIDPYELMRAGEIMVTAVDTLPAALPIGAACDALTAPDSRHRFYPVVDQARRLVGVASRTDGLRWRSRTGATTLGECVAGQTRVTASPHDPVSHVLDLMISDDRSLIPVVEPKTGTLRGIITRKDVLAVRRAVGVLERDRRRFFRRRKTTLSEPAIQLSQ
jgi:chloride channel protein, CIC family